MHTKSFFYAVSPIVFVTLILLLRSTMAHADDHDIRGCLYVMDTRSGSATEGDYAPLTDLTIYAWYTDWAGEHQAFGTLGDTNESGCFSGKLTWVPEETTIKVGTITQNSDWMVTDDNFPYFVYNYQFSPGIDVYKGETADFEFLGVPESLGDAHGVLLVYRTMKDGIDLYEDKTGEAWTGYPDIPVRFPSAGSSFASGNPSWADPWTGIHITTEGLSDYALFHEWGHWLAYQDSSTVIILPNYCADYVGVAYPYNIDPYTYTDPDRPECGHNLDSYENPETSNLEGYADFIRDFLRSKTGDTDARYDDDGLNFWGQGKQQNVTHTLLDLVDARNESVTYRHVYQNSGSNLFKAVDSSPGLFPNSLYSKRIGMDGTYAYAPSVTDEYGIYKFPLTYGAAPTAVYTGLPYKPQYIAADASKNLCVFSDNDNLYCGSTSGASPLTDVSLPFAGRIADIALVDGELFVQSMSGPQMIYRGVKKCTTTSSTPKWKLPISKSLCLPTWNWSLVYTAGADELIKHMAVDSGKSELYIGGGTQDSSGVVVGLWIKSCSLASVCAPSLLLGSESQMGYRRGAAAQTLLDGNEIVWADHYIYYADQYGVARYSKSTGTLDQYFHSPARTFINDLHPLSGGEDLDSFVLATNGTKTLIQNFDSDGAEYRLYYIDDAEPYTLEYYCGKDNATLPAKDVVHMYKIWGAYGGDFMTDLAGIKGMTASIETGVSQVNWLTLKKSAQDCPPWEDDVIVSGNATATATTTTEAVDDSTSGPCVVSDGSDQQNQPGQEQLGPKLGPIQSLTPESIEVDDPDRTYPPSTTAHGSDNDLNVGP